MSYPRARSRKIRRHRQARQARARAAFPLAVYALVMAARGEVSRRARLERWRSAYVESFGQLDPT